MGEIQYERFDGRDSMGEIRREIRLARFEGRAKKCCTNTPDTIPRSECSLSSKSNSAAAE